MGNTEYKELRRRYPLFEYAGYGWREETEGMRLEFEFRMGAVTFHPSALIERRPFLDFQIDPSVLDRLVFDIGMVELVSYWKSACAPEVRVACGTLTEAQSAFWKKLYWNGLGEFFYTNGIAATMEDFMELRCSEEDSRGGMRSGRGCAEGYIVPVGGGKDSVVTLELLRGAGKRIRPLVMNPRGATVECCRVAGFPMEEVLVIRRGIDPELLRLNGEGYLNGHTPFSAMLAFYTRLASELSGIPNVALSNESSANESTVVGTSVNHQYSKSLEFEDDFRAYAEGFNYFSFLRPLSELQIAMLFSRYRQYHDVFRSCNVGSKQDVWCGHCAKCLFAYIILSPFIEPARMDSIFGHNLLDDEALRREFEQLTGQAETKPFECVGTVAEVRQALGMTLRRWYGVSRPRLLEGVEEAWFQGGESELGGLLSIGNLTSEERKIIEGCIESKI